MEERVRECRFDNADLDVLSQMSFLLLAQMSFLLLALPWKSESMNADLTMQISLNADFALAWLSCSRAIQEQVSYSLFQWKSESQESHTRRGGGLGSRPKKMYGERLGDGVEYHSMKPTPRR